MVSTGDSPSVVNDVSDTALASNVSVAVIGAGTMGAGIAQVAAAAGHRVIIFDCEDGAAISAIESIDRGFDKLLLSGKRTRAQVDELLARICATADLSAIADCGLVIEAIVESLGIKKQLLADIESVCGESTIIASNTSSISISALAADLRRPEKLLGMHFFNPAAILKLVEVVSGAMTSHAVAVSVFATASAWGKQPIHVKSSPGFVVNRVARPYYAEALRSLSEQVASVDTIDILMRECGGFKMGPLELIDLIGQDVNAAVTESIYQSFYQDKKFMPSVLQADMVAAGLLGVKSGRGFYNYAAPRPAPVDPDHASSVDGSINVTLWGDFSPIPSLVSCFNQAGILFEHPDPNGCEIPTIICGDISIRLTDGRTANRVVYEEDIDKVVLLDYAADYCAASYFGLSYSSALDENDKGRVIRLFRGLGKNVLLLKDVPGMQVMRTISMLINEAYDAVNQGVCTLDAVDVAMKAGVAYPRGPIAWGHLIGVAYIVRVLTNIKSGYGEERYRISPLLMDEWYRLRLVMPSTADLL